MYGSQPVVYFVLMKGGYAPDTRLLDTCALASSVVETTRFVSTYKISFDRVQTGSKHT